MSSLPAVVIDLVPGLSIEELESRLLAASRTSDVGKRALAFYLQDMDERRAAEVLGYPSAVHFAVARLSLSRRDARDLVATGRRLLELERVDRAFLEGRLSWSKARALARVASPEHEEAWLEMAGRLTSNELEREVAMSRAGSAPRENRLGIPTTKIRLSARIDPVTYELWEKARKKLGGDVTDEEMIRLLARMVLEGVEAGPKGREAGSLGKPVSVLTANCCPKCRAATLETEEGLVELDEATLERFICDARCECGDHEEGGEGGEKAPPTPPWLRENVIRRDGGRCRMCGGDVALTVHHIVWRSRGGPTVETNLVSLCDSCHGRVHAGFLRVEGCAPEAIVFRDRYGRLLKKPERVAIGPAMWIVSPARLAMSGA